ncbi:MAG: hypothetical protein LBM62_00955 [Mediterranea sp.]|jgi:hypothetical protein|nr:hypothetical protein [Mediterranea sp.]
MNIETLLSRYFEGETSCEEERELRRYFTEEEVPEALQNYRPLFAYLTNEADKAAEAHRPTPTDDKPLTRRRPHIKLYRIAGIAAAVALLISIGSEVWQATRTRPHGYVIIDGKEYTDMKLVQAQAQAALEEVQLSPEEINRIFPFE